MSETPPKVILVAFACEPGKGSEEGVGWAWLKAATEVAAVTVLTTPRTAPIVREATEELGLSVDVVAVDLPPATLRLFPKKLIFVYYVLWQTLASKAVRRIERSQPIAAVHHITWASDSLPSALLASQAPVRIWGPVGGSTRTARGLYQYLGRRGQLDQAFRDVVNGVLRRLFGLRVARHATLVVAVNHDVADEFASCGTPVTLENNLALDHAELAATEGSTDILATPADGSGEGLRTLLFVGRLIPWKGLLLAVRVMAHAPGWRLVVAGEGPDRPGAEQLAAELGVADRITFTGLVPRTDVLAAFGRADAMLMVSYHDSGPWSVGEASALGCPIVCLDAGGHSLMAGKNGHVVPVGDGRRLPERIAEALDQVQERGEPDLRWSGDRLPGVLRAWYAGEADGATAESTAEEASR